MLAMKDSGIEWIGEIPQEWRVSKVKHSYDVVLGKMLQTNQKSETDELLPYMCAANITWAGVDLSTEKQMWFSESEKSLYLLKHGDLLVTEGGDVAVSCIWMDELPQCCIQNAVHRVRPIDNASNRFLYYWLYTLKNQGYFDLVCNKATLAHFTKEKLDSCFLIVPPTDEQERIASFLDTKCAEIDALIAAKEKTNALLKERRQSIIYEAVTKGLDPTIPMKDSGVEWIGETPEGWSVGKLGYFIEVYNGDRSSNYPSGNDLQEEGIPFLTSSNLEEDIIDTSTCKYISEEKYNSLAGFKMRIDDIVYCLRGSVGKCAINKTEHCGTIASSLMGIRCKSIDPDWLLFLLKSSVFSAQNNLFMNGTCAANLSAESICTYLIPVCPIEEQRAIADYLIQNCKQIGELIKKNSAEIQKLKEYRQSLIYEAVTGKIEV